MSETYSRRIGPRIDLTGHKYGKLTVLRQDGGRKYRTTYFWLCRCECGQEVSIRGNGLRSGGVETCGCLHGKMHGWKPIDNGDGTLGIPLTKGFVATIDADDLAIVANYSWSVRHGDKTSYAVTSRLGSNGKRRPFAMHRDLIDAKDGEQVDHRDCNGLNNRRSNLRICTARQNNCNKIPKSGSSSMYKGVSLSRSRSSSDGWTAVIRVIGKLIRLGVFATQEEAARAYDAAAIQYNGEFARLNFPVADVPAIG